MNQYYLIAQLPSLDALGESAPLPITEERFYELCNRFLSKKALKSLSKLTLIPNIDEEKSGSSFIDTWNEGERLLRLALCKVRAGNMKKSFETDKTFSPALMQAVRTATEYEDPLGAEQFLNNYRLQFLEEICPSDAFSEDAVFYYGLKLKLLSRIKCFDIEKGREQYEKIYSSIMSGEEQDS